MFIFFRSIKFEIGRPNDYSISPYRKNSAYNRSVQFWVRCQGFVEFDKSARWKNIFIVDSLSFELIYGLNSVVFNLYFMRSRFCICLDISVARTAFIIISRALFYISRFNVDSISQEGSFMISIAEETWKFSRTAWSKLC
jgi:hypothetical protein